MRTKAHNRLYRSGGYRVIYWHDIDDPEPKVLHEPTYSKSEKLSSGKITKRVNEADEFIFTIPTNNPHYSKLKVIKGLVRVENLFDNTIEFYGRVIEINGSMTAQGGFSQEIICESSLAYLNDMTMAWEKRRNRGPDEFLKHVIWFYNQRVEKHKQFKVGRVNMPYESDRPYLYTTYESAWDTIKNRLLDKFGGHIVMRAERDGNYIDYLKEIGEHKKTPIKLGKNIKSASRNISLEDMMTQIVPIGGDDENYKDPESENGNSSDIIRPQINISSVNLENPTHVMTLYDEELMKQFGVIRKVVQWSEITDPRILKARGWQYLRDQKVALANWKVSAVDRYLIDDEYEKFEVGNYHPVENPPLSGIEELQIISKEIDILNPQSVELEIGADSLTISSFQLQQRQAQESIEKLNQDMKIANAKAEADRAKRDEQIAVLQNQQIEHEARLSGSESEKAETQRQINNLQRQIDELQKQNN
ncbi:phage tail spike protein [Streptococcus sp. 10F2]